MKKIAVAVFLCASFLVAQVQIGKNVQIGSAAGGGGAGNPGGVNTNAQFNNAGSFAGSKATFDAPGNAKTLSNDGIKNAFLYQTTPTSNDGIKNALSTPGSNVVVGPDYPGTEGGFGGVCPGDYREALGCPAPFANDTTFIDYRSPGVSSYSYNTGDFLTVDRWVSNQQPQSTGGGHLVEPYLKDWEMSGSGKNGFEGGGPDSFTPIQLNFEYMRRGIVSAINIEEQSPSMGDNHIYQNTINSIRGSSDGSGEGFNTIRNQIAQNLTPMVNIANSTLAAGATLIQGTHVTGTNDLPGDGTYYIDSTKAGAIFKILATTNPGDAGAGTPGTWTVSNTFTPDNIGRVATPVSTPKQYYGATTNETVNITGLTSAIDPSKTVCYADGPYQESARVVNAGSFSGGTATGVVIALRYVHQANAYVSQGSHACNFVEARANEFPGTYPGRQIFRIIGASAAHTILYSRTVFGNWNPSHSGFFSTSNVAGAGTTLTRNGSNVVSVPVSDPNLFLSGVAASVSGCADSSFNGIVQLTSDSGTVVTWANTGAATSTTCTNDIEILSRLNDIGVREAQEFPGGEIVNTNDPTTFAINYNISVEPNTNFQVTAGDQLEGTVYHDVIMGFDHNLMDFSTQNSQSVSSIMHFDKIGNEIPEGTTWSRVSFTDPAIHYLGLGGTKPIGNKLFDMADSVTPFNTLWSQLPSPAIAAFTFQGCLFGCTDARSNFSLISIPTNAGNYKEQIHQDTGQMEISTTNATNVLSVKLSPGAFSNVIHDGTSSNQFFWVPGETRDIIEDGAGQSSVVDQQPGAIFLTATGGTGIASHVNQSSVGWSSDVPITVPSCTGCGTGGSISLTTTGTSGAATLTGSVLNIPVYTPSSPGVASFNTRTGAVVPVSGDYSFSLLSGSLGNSQGPSALTGLLKDTAGVLSVATAGTDYLTPTGNGSGLTALNGSNVSSGTVAAARLPNFGSAAAGIVPLSGGGAVNFLRADGTWATPAGSGLTDCTDTSTVSFICTVPISAPSFSTTGTTPGAASLAAGTGSIPTLPANSAGLAAPVTGGTSYLLKLPATITAGIAHFATPGTVDGVNESAVTSSQVVAADIANNTITGTQMANNTVTATQLAAQYSKGSCTEVWGGSGTSFALTSGDDAISNNTCYNDSGVTRTITAVKCRSSVASNTTTVNPTFGAAGTGTTVLSGALTCGSSLAYSSSGTVTGASWTTGTGITPAMGGTLTGTSISMIVEFTY